jgi:hypothetical protein
VQSQALPWKTEVKVNRTLAESQGVPRNGKGNREKEMKDKKGGV